MNQPDLSVIISTYNRAEQLNGLLKNFENQNYPREQFSWELIIVDNNSKDNTRQLVQEWIEKKTLRIVYEFEPRQGKSFALNRAIKIARSEHLAFTDDDVILDPLWLSSIHKAFKENEYDCFGGKVIPIIEGGLPDYLTEDSRYPTHLTVVGNHDLGDKIRDYRRRTHGPSGANMFMRKKLFEQHGYYRTDMGCWGEVDSVFGEDTELMNRFRKNGVDILYYPAAVLYHPSSQEKLKKSFIRKYTWGCARGDARWLNISENTIKYFNIPRYLIREAFQEFVKFLFSQLSRKKYKKFYHEIQFLYRLGILYDFYMMGNDD